MKKINYIARAIKKIESDGSEDFNTIRNTLDWVFDGALRASGKDVLRELFWAVLYCFLFIMAGLALDAWFILGHSDLIPNHPIFFYIVHLNYWGYCYYKACRVQEKYGHYALFWAYKKLGW